MFSIELVLVFFRAKDPLGHLYRSHQQAEHRNLLLVALSLGFAKMAAALEFWFKAGS
jgi:hypothetical protein